ncbi:MAG TPA: hypothetical protein VFR17_12075 [Mycobacterium sp.]|nr:hypothetical protein [Mycobacterium sp.]
MSNPSEPDHGDAADAPAPDQEETSEAPATDPGDDAATEVIVTGEPAVEPKIPEQEPAERRFTAPGFDSTATEVIPSMTAAPTEIMPTQPGANAAPPLVPSRSRILPVSIPRGWAWVLAVVTVIVVLAVIAVLGTLWLTKDSRQKASRTEQVRDTIENYDIALQNGDLAALRGLTCGAVRESYVNYNDAAWDDTYQKISEAKQYPVVASIDEVVVEDDHAEANVTAFMAFAPQVRSTRSFDLQYHDNQWKICQSRGG